MINQDAVAACDTDGSDYRSYDDDQKLVILEKPFHIACKAGFFCRCIAVKFVRISLFTNGGTDPEYRDQDQGENHGSDKITVAVCHRFTGIVDCRAEVKDERHCNHRQDNANDGSACTAGGGKELTDA